MSLAAAGYFELREKIKAKIKEFEDDTYYDFESGKIEVLKELLNE